MKSISRRTTAKAIALALSCFAITSTSIAAQWPDGPVSMVVGFSPGGSSDTLARAVAQQLEPVLKQSVVVENKPGAGATIAAAKVASAQPNGNTLLFVTSGHAGSGALYNNLPYDPVTAFAPVVKVASTPVVIVVAATQPWKTLDDLVGAAKKSPGALNYAAGGGGATTTALAAEFLKHGAGLDMKQIPYKGSGPALTALLGGEVQVGFDIPSSSIPHIEAGKLRALAVTSKARIPALANVPTVAESGLKDFEVNGWFGVMAPAGTPNDVIDRLNREINIILNKPEMQSVFAKYGLTAGGGSPSEFKQLLVSDAQRFGAAIRRMGLGAK